MEVYKDKQYLVFDFEDGKTVKYDFATHTSFGISGKPVKNLNAQLRGYNIYDVIRCCSDPNYGRFLKFVKDRYGTVTSLGTILSRVNEYAHYEQIFSAGLKTSDAYIYPHMKIPSGLIKLCRKYNINLTVSLIDRYNKYPDTYNYVLNVETESLTINDKLDILYRSHYNLEGYVPLIVHISETYGCTIKGIINYIDYLNNFEGIAYTHRILTDYCDYLEMSSEMSRKFDKYPRHFLTTHNIVARNHRRLMKEFNEEKFKSIVKPEMEFKFNDYVFMYPKTTADIKDEAVQQNNCVASYIDRVLGGMCDILFLREADAPDRSLVTIEVRDDRIVQARQHYNDAVTAEQQKAIDAWNKYWADKCKQKLNAA